MGYLWRSFCDSNFVQVSTPLCLSDEGAQTLGDHNEKIGGDWVALSKAALRNNLLDLNTIVQNA